jgi:hypothetical protein
MITRPQADGTRVDRAAVDESVTKHEHDVNAPPPVPSSMRRMPATIARIDAELVEAGRTRYRLTLSCRCVFFELRAQTDRPPNIGEVVYCYAAHPVRKRR